MDLLSYSNAIIDTLIVAFFIYTIILLLSTTRSIFIFRGIFTLLFVYLVSLYFHLGLTVALFRSIFPFFSIIIVIVFQKEFRKFFENLSIDALRRFFLQKSTPGYARTVDVLIEAVSYFQERKIGALLVFPGSQPLEQHIEGGYELDGKLSTPLLISIFDPSSPGHDGALVVEEGKVARFGVHLPLAEQLRKVKDSGTRHRAGLGLAERTDALVLIISEEHGTISIAELGNIRQVTTDELRERLMSFNRALVRSEEQGRPSEFLTRNFQQRAFAVLLALLLRFIILTP